MSLECRSCGEKLPLVAVTDAPASPLDIAPPPENIWKSAPHLPPADSFGDDDTIPVTVHGEAAGAPSISAVFAAPVVAFMPLRQAETPPSRRLPPRCCRSRSRRTTLRPPPRSRQRASPA